MRKFAAISLAGIMAFGALPVMAEETSTEEASTEAATEAGSEAAESDQVENNWEPFAENVTLRVPVYDRGVEGVPDVTNNYWTQWIQENFGDKYNITVEYVPITRTDVMTSYALLAADQNLPTILMEYDYPKLSTWVNDGYLTSFDMDAFKEVAQTTMLVWKQTDRFHILQSVMRLTSHWLLIRITTSTIHGRHLFVWTG